MEAAFEARLAVVEARFEALKDEIHNLRSDVHEDMSRIESYLSKLEERSNPRIELKSLNGNGRWRARDVVDAAKTAGIIIAILMGLFGSLKRGPAAEEISKEVIRLLAAEEGAPLPERAAAARRATARAAPPPGETPLP